MSQRRLPWLLLVTLVSACSILHAGITISADLVEPRKLVIAGAAPDEDGTQLIWQARADHDGVDHGGPVTVKDHRYSGEIDPSAFDAGPVRVWVAEMGYSHPSEKLTVVLP